MKLFRNPGILGSLVLIGLTGCSGAAQEASNKGPVQEASNEAPVAQQVTLTTATTPAYVGAVLRGRYQYTDPNNDSESGTQKAWLRDGQPIEGANQDNYTATAQDSGKSLQFRVTPASATGQSPGAAVASPGIVIENSAPTITLSGLVGASSVFTTGVGSELRVEFSYNDVDGDAPDAAEIRWLRNKSPIPNATGPRYIVTRADLDYPVVAEVTPLAVKGVLRGATVFSDSIVIVNSMPVAQNVELKATTPVIIGSTLTASYTYFDADNEPEAGSQFRWLRNGATILGATGRNYKLTLLDAGKTLAVEVTPRAQTGALAGLPVLSNAVTVKSLVFTVSADFKQLRFSWAAVPGASFYKVSYNPDGVSGFVPVSTTSSALTTTAYDWDISVHRINWPNAQFLLEACDASNCVSSAMINALDVMISAIGYFKASNTSSGDHFGTAVALSADGNTLAVGAPDEDSAAIGVGGNQTHACTIPPVVNCATDSGAVYVYARSGTRWSQQAYLKTSNTNTLPRIRIPWVENLTGLEPRSR